MGANYLEVCRNSPDCEDARPALEGIQAVLAGKRKSFSLEYACHAPGEQRWFWMNVTPLDTRAGGAVVAHTNITKRKVAEEARRESEERFRRYFELGLVGMAITPPAKGWLQVNDRICELLGYERDELLTTTWADLTFPADLAADLDNFNRVLAGEFDGYTLEKRWVRKGGRVIDSIISVKCVRRRGASSIISWRWCRTSPSARPRNARCVKAKPAWRRPSALPTWEAGSWNWRQKV